jgi:hypothetical protein
MWDKLVRSKCVRLRLNLDHICGSVVMRVRCTNRIMRMSRFEMRNRPRQPAMRDYQQYQQEQEANLAHRACGIRLCGAKQALEGCDLHSFYITATTPEFPACARRLSSASIMSGVG